MPAGDPHTSAESTRLAEAREARVPWRKWGPYLSERQWGTIREDYSESGDAWSYFSHDQSRSRAYRWGEDGLAGISDDKQQLCFAVALWNGRDPQAAFPYDDIVKTNHARGRHELEYELLATGVFDADRYFDVFVEYAKASPEDVLVQITVTNRGPEAAPLHVLPTIWFRNVWSWGGNVPRPTLKKADASSIAASHPELGERRFCADGAPEWLFTENETNTERFGRGKNATPHVKDGINNYIVDGQGLAVNHRHTGTKAAAHYELTVGAGASHVIRLRLSDIQPAAPAGTSAAPFGPAFVAVMTDRHREADEFYKEVIPAWLTADAANVMRQALAGMLWSKQFYLYDVDRWLSERGADPFKPRRRIAPRNDRWHHMLSADVISMPDKWEYPWYAAWDLAFHVLALTLVDEDFGKQQLDLMLQERYLHPSGQIPACEWNFGDVNPPVHAWSTIFTYRMEQAHRGRGDLEWLDWSFHKLMLNFTWWVNRKDRTGSNVFEGGFLGLDNIGVFDRSSPLPAGGHLEQADGTAWMALFCQNMLEIAAELALEKPAYAYMSMKLLEHSLSIASSMIHAGDDVGMWDEKDGFFYDVLRLPDGRAERLEVRSMVGLLPLCAVTVFEGRLLKKYPELGPRLQQFLAARPELTAFVQDPAKRGENNRLLGSLLNEQKLRRVLTRMLDENEFLSPYGIRSRGTTTSIPACSRPAARSIACRTCRPNRTAACSAATPTGEGRYGCRSTR